MKLRSLALFLAVILPIASLRADVDFDSVFTESDQEVGIVNEPAHDLLTSFVLTAEQPSFWRPFGFSAARRAASADLQLLTRFIFLRRATAIPLDAAIRLDLQTQHPTVQFHRLSRGTAVAVPTIADRVLVF